jgi:hypothetical protein
MKTTLTILLSIVLCSVALASETNTVVSLEITVDDGVITGYVRNSTTNAITVNSRHLYGHWEFTSVLYRYGRWREAPYTEDQRAHLGSTLPPVEIELKPGEVLVAPKARLSHLLEKASADTRPYTFKIDLSEHDLPETLWNISQLRVVTCDLWSNIIPLRNPNKNVERTRNTAPLK